MLNHDEIGKHAERITKIKPFINKYKWEGTIFLLEKKIGINLRKIMQDLPFTFCMWKEKKYIMLIWRNKDNSRCYSF